MGKKFIFILISAAVLLSGCWDELLYKDITTVPLLGLEGNEEEMTAHFAYPIFENDQVTHSTSTGKGLSLREARDDANHKTMEVLDLSQMEVLLISDEMAKKDLYKYLDPFFRLPRSRLSSYVALVQGDMKQYFQPPGPLVGEVATYYRELLITSDMYTYSPHVPLQKASTLMFEKDIDLSLPYLVIDDQGIPKLNGTGLFVGGDFTGSVLNMRDSTVATLLKTELGKSARLTYRWENEGKASPVTVNVAKIKRKYKISQNRIKIDYSFEVVIEELPDHRLKSDKHTAELETFLTTEMTKDANDVIGKLQQAKSDIIGVGRRVRAFHPEIWKKGDWNETFGEIDIEAAVQVKIKNTGILE